MGTIAMLFEAGMCARTNNSQDIISNLKPWASEKLYSEVVMELYDDIDTHDRPEHQWGRGGRIVRRDSLHDPTTPGSHSSLQSINAGRSPASPRHVFFSGDIKDGTNIEQIIENNDTIAVPVLRIPDEIVNKQERGRQNR